MIFSQVLFIEKHLRSGGVSVTVRRLCVKVFPQHSPDKCLQMTADWYKMFYEGIAWKTIYNEQGGVAMEHAVVKDYVKIPKQEYSLLKEVYRTVKRQAFLVRLDESERNLAAGKTKTISVDDFVDAV
jgi:hypothetical protein